MRFAAVIARLFGALSVGLALALAGCSSNDRLAVLTSDDAASQTPDKADFNPFTLET